MMYAGQARKPKTMRRDGTTGERCHYFCSTYHTAAVDKRLPACPCLRNLVHQHEVEPFLQRWLDETGTRLELLTSGLDASNLTTRLATQDSEAWVAFTRGVARLAAYLLQHHAAEYASICEDLAAQALAAPTGRSPARGERLSDHLGSAAVAAWERHKSDPSRPGGFVDAILASYRAHFDPAAVAAEIEKLDAEHTTLTHRYADLPTPRAKEKAKAELTALEGRIEELESQQADAADTVEGHWRQMLDLQHAIAEAKQAMAAEAGERHLRMRAKALSAVIRRIDCTFTATGKTGGGPGNSNAKLMGVTITPSDGEAITYRAGNALQADKVNSSS
jgi:hypothetical protein